MVRELYATGRMQMARAFAGPYSVCTVGITSEPESWNAAQVYHIAHSAYVRWLASERLRIGAAELSQ